MKKSILKGALLLTSMIALAAPAGASATVWGPVGSTGTIKSTYAIASSAAGGVMTWQCNTPQQYGYTVRNPASATLNITSATLGSCFTTGMYPGCTVTQAATGLPWTATAAGTTITLNVGNVNLTFSGTCSWSGLTLQESGSLAFGTWSAATHTATFSSSPGLTLSYMGGWVQNFQYSMALKDVAQTLTVT
jgi:hypothetical protein